MFDVFLKELAKRLNLGERADGLLGMLLALIFDEQRGGYAGFIDRFRAKGLDQLVTTWMGNGENHSLSLPQLESVLGTSVIQQMATRLDLSVGTTGAALAQMLPTVLDKLSPDGRLPVGLSVPEPLKAYLGAHADFARTAVMPEVAATHAAVRTLEHAPHAAGSRNSRLWLLLIPVLVSPLYFIHMHSQSQPQAAPKSAPLEPAQPSPDARTPAAASGDAMHQDGLEPVASGDPVADAAPPASAYSEAELLAALNEILWAFVAGGSELDANSNTQLVEAARLLSLAPEGSVLTISGFAADAPAAEQPKVANARAERLRTELLKQGVPGARLIAQSQIAESLQSQNKTVAILFSARTP